MTVVFIGSLYTHLDFSSINRAFCQVFILQVNLLYVQCEGHMV